MPRIRYVNSASTAGGDGTTNATSGANRAYATMGAALTAEIGSAPPTDDITFYVTGAFVGSVPIGDTEWDNGSWHCNGKTIIVEAEANNRHNGVWNVSCARFSANANSGAMGGRLNLTFGAERGQIIFRNLQMELTGNVVGSSVHNLFRTKSNANTTGNLIFDSCIARTDISQGRQKGVFIRYDLSNSNASLIIVNCLFENFQETVQQTAAGGKVIVYNTLTANSVFGPSGLGASNVIIKNCITQDEANSGYRNTSGLGIDTSANNISEDATSPQTELRNIVLDFIDKANGNYRLAATDTEAIDYGVNLSSDDVYPFTHDITGSTRTGTWDIGPFSYTTASGAVLSGQYAVATGKTKVVGAVDSTKAEGYIWAVITTSATTPSHAQIKAGQDHTGAAAPWFGVKAGAANPNIFYARALSAGTVYYAHFTQEDNTPTASTPVSTLSVTTKNETILSDFFDIFPIPTGGY